MIFLTGRMGVGKSYSVAEYLEEKDNPIYIIDEYSSYDSLAEKSNVNFYKPNEWNMNLIEKIRETKNVILIIEENDNVFDIIYDVRTHLEEDNKTGKYISVLMDIGDKLANEQDMHLRLNDNYQVKREQGLIGNPLIESSS